MKLYLVRGHDVDGENQDAFVVACDPESAIGLWNDDMIENGYPRCHGDDEYQLPRGRTVEPANVREILWHVEGTQYDGVERVVPWEEIQTVA